MSTRLRTKVELAAAEAAARESRRRAERDAAAARLARERGESIAGRLDEYNAANHFADWIFRDGAGGSA